MQTATVLPEKFLERLKLLYSATHVEQILSSMQQKRLPAFRINTIKSDKEHVLSALHMLDFEVQSVAWYKDAFILKNKSVRELTDTDIYKQGFIYIQNLSSMVPAIVLDPKPNEIILDLAAAPGSKTTQIAALMKNTGEITANDISYKRLFKLKENLKSQGVTNTKVLNLPGEWLWKQLPEYFDKTLVDTACSMEGRIQVDDPETYKDWSYKKIKQLSKLQEYLLRSAVALTKVGGTIVYSTCTLAPEENEGVVQWVIEKTKGAVEVEKITINDLPLAPAVTHWNKKLYPQAQHSSRVLPSENMEGFYVAKLIKKSSTNA